MAGTGGAAGGLADLAAGAMRLRDEAAGAYRGSAHFFEAVPLGPSEGLPIGGGALGSLHAFAAASPLYSGSRRAGGYALYEGDVTQHWLDSIKHDASCAPFYPTWLVSAHVLAAAASALGARSAFDVGSGDGRIAHCCAAAGMRAVSVEIDPGLARLQEESRRATGARYESFCADGAEFGYAGARPERPAFFIGGLPEVGEVLAGRVASRVLGSGIGSPLFVLAGSLALREGARDRTVHGWGRMLSGLGLEARLVLELPTMWTVEQERGTPYVFASPARRG